MSGTETFEQSMAELERIVARLQEPDIPLEEAVELFRRGTELAQQSEALLARAELQVQQLTHAVRERFASYELEGEEAPSE